MSVIDLRACTLTREHVAHVHRYHQLILATCGSTELAIEGHGDRITGSRGCLIPCGRHHEYQGDGQNRTFVLDVPVTGLAGECELIDRLFDQPRFFVVPNGLHRMADSLMPQLEQFPVLHNEIAVLLLRALSLHLHDDNAALHALKAPTAVSERLDLERIDSWIDRHLADEIRVDDLARQCALSPGHFHHCFRLATGVTPQAYVQRRRLAHAQALVERGDLPLGQVGIQVGFRDQGSFSRAYRRQFGNPPSCQRRGHGSNA